MAHTARRLDDARMQEYIRNGYISFNSMHVKPRARIRKNTPNICFAIYFATMDIIFCYDNWTARNFYFFSFIKPIFLDRLRIGNL